MCEDIPVVELASDWCCKRMQERMRKKIVSVYTAGTSPGLRTKSIPSFLPPSFPLSFPPVFRLCKKQNAL
jgi:hypothetical protein